MTMSGTTHWLKGLIVAGAAAFAIAGCGEVPLNAPPALSQAEVSHAAPQLFGTGPDGESSLVSAPDLDSRDGAHAAGSTSTSLSTSTSVNGSVGGTLSCGRFRVTIPAGAFSGTGTVSMRMPDMDVAVVDLNITPATLNSFRNTVDLSYDPTGQAAASTVTIYWFDSNKKVWVDLVARVDAKTGLPTVRLKHFSPYGAGKAGW